MEYRRLGKSGLQVSALSFGSWLTFGNQINDKTADELMGIAYDAGVNFFDNAEGYAEGKSEIVMGNILKAHKLLSKNILKKTDQGRLRIQNMYVA